MDETSTQNLELLLLCVGACDSGHSLCAGERSCVHHHRAGVQSSTSRSIFWACAVYGSRSTVNIDCACRLAVALPAIASYLTPIFNRIYLPTCTDTSSQLRVRDQCKPAYQGVRCCAHRCVVSGAGRESIGCSPRARSWFMT